MGIRLSRPNTSATPHPSLKQLRQVLRAKVLSISISTKYVAAITTRATTQLTGLSQTKNMPTHIKNSTVSHQCMRVILASVPPLISVATPWTIS